MPEKSTYVQYMIDHPDHRCVAFFQHLEMCNKFFLQALHVIRGSPELGFDVFKSLKAISTPLGGRMFFVNYGGESTLSRCKGIEIDAFITDELHVTDRLKVHDFMMRCVRPRSK